MPTIHDAIRSGNLPELKRLLDQGADLEEYNDQGHTPLMTACLSKDADLELVRLLIDHGANVNAPTRPDDWRSNIAFDAFDDIDDDSFDPELRELLASTRAILESTASKEESCGPEHSTVFLVAAAEAGIEKLRLLIEQGADPAFRTPHGYTALIHAACAARSDILPFLLEAGAPMDGSTMYGESPLSVFSRQGLFADVRVLLDAGADPAPLGWSPLHHAVVFGTVDEVAGLLDQGADIESTDGWERTALLLAIHAGRTDMAEVLLERGANRDARGRCGRTAAHYPTDRDHAATLTWLVERGFPINMADEFGATPLMMAVESSAVACFDVLLGAGADWRQKDQNGNPLIRNATSPAIIRRLVELGQNLSDLEPEPLREWIGLGTRDELPVSEKEYRKGRFRKFGKRNPERMDVPFWNAMVRNGWTAFRAADQFGDSSFGRGKPVWCHRRFGMSLTALPDGRFIQIGGEHEDHYDPDFCIYNEVIIHDGKGGFEILGYPEKIFPPTDFHSATLVGEWIYIIGNLGYEATHKTFGPETPVFRFHIPSGKIERVIIQGTSPGWIHRHEARLDGHRIIVSGGKIMRPDNKGEHEIVDFQGCFALDLDSFTWSVC